MSSALPIPGIPLAYCVGVCVRACLLSNTGGKKITVISRAFWRCAFVIAFLQICVSGLGAFENWIFLTNIWLCIYEPARGRPLFSPGMWLARMSIASECLFIHRSHLLCKTRWFEAHSLHLGAAAGCLSVFIYGPRSKKEQFVWKMLTLVPISTLTTTLPRSHQPLQVTQPCAMQTLRAPSDCVARVTETTSRYTHHPPDGRWSTGPLSESGSWRSPYGRQLSNNVKVYELMLQEDVGSQWGFWGSALVALPPQVPQHVLVFFPRCHGNRIP